MDTLEELHSCFDNPPSFLTLRRAMLLLLRLHWAEPSMHSELGVLLKGLVYASDDDPADHRTLRIEQYDFQSRGENTSYPLILSGFPEGFVSKKQVINNKAGSVDGNTQEHYTHSMTGSLKLSHRHRSPDTALAMAEDTFRFLEALRSEMRCNLQLTRFDLGGISGIRPVKEVAETYFKVDISAVMSFNSVMKFERADLRIKKQVLTVTGAV